jgi:putative CocE/NonD family hydrolase
MEVTGQLVVKLWAGSDAKDTDFTVKLVDVYPPSRDYPAGVDLNVADGIVRARYRASDKVATLLDGTEAREYTIETYPTSLVFGRGHRIRVDISSSNFPRFDVNPNTGEPLNQNRGWRVAENAIYHDPQHPSRIILPVIPAK